ncbi:MAG: hypothetical protein ACHP84_00150 [Caulobacterales bacterium]
MRDFMDVRGESGRFLRFMLLKDGRPLSPMGGNYLYVRQTGDRTEILYAGEAQNLLLSALDRWTEASELLQAQGVYTRLNISERTRQLEHDDIVRGVRPQMNLTSEHLAQRDRPVREAPSSSLTDPRGESLKPDKRAAP